MTKTTTDMVFCHECAYWVAKRITRDEPATTGECHRHAPRTTDGFGRSLWPITQDLDRCGDGKPAGNTETAQ